jgi:hypothetical protein
MNTQEQDPMDEQFWYDQEQADEDQRFSELESNSLNDQAER